MRKRIVASMLVIALAAALLGGATLAWFTDRTSADAEFTAGTIKLGKPVAVPLNIPAMAPGDTTPGWDITVKNEGTLDMYYRLYFEGEAAGSLAEVLTVSIDGVEKGTLASLIGTDNAVFDQDMRLNSGAADKVLTFSFHLPVSADNTYQGKAFTGNLVVEATQVANQGAEIKWDNN